MLSRVVLASGPGARLAWELSKAELGISRGSTIHAGRLTFFCPWVDLLGGQRLMVGDAKSWPDFREALRLLDRSGPFDGSQVLGLDGDHPPLLPLDIPADVRSYFLPLPQSAHQSRCQAQQLLSGLDAPSARLEALIRESL